MLRNKYVALAVGILLSCVIAYNIYFFYTKNKRAGVSEVKSKPPVAEAIYNNKYALSEKRFEPKDKGEWKKDPFGIRLDESISYGGLKLQGIIHREGRGYALINGKLYGIGDSIDGGKIKAIERRSVIFLRDGRTEKISFEDYIVLNPVRKLEP
jgi:type II secretory pathway component PulC